MEFQLFTKLSHRKKNVGEEGRRDKKAQIKLKKMQVIS